MEPDSLKTSLELQYASQGLVCGVDEVGRGPWAGPVIAAAVILDLGKIDPHLLSQINDSKKLTASKREAIWGSLMSFPEGVSWGLGEASVAEIDDLNILQASLLAMERAVAALPLSPAVALVDGLHPPRLPCLAIPVVRGDSLSISIGAASIGAKVHRDRLMESLALEYPGYGWEKNAGYGTALHRQGLAQLGVSPHHRRSFKPIRALLPSA